MLCLLMIRALLVLLLESIQIVLLGILGWLLWEKLLVLCKTDHSYLSHFRVSFDLLCDICSHLSSQWNQANTSAKLMTSRSVSQINPLLLFTLLSSVYVSVCVVYDVCVSWMWMHRMSHIWRSEVLWTRSVLLLWVPGIKLRSSGLYSNGFIHWAILPPGPSVLSS